MAGEVRIERVTAGHVDELAASLRAADAAEVEALGLTPVEALRASWSASEYSGAVRFDRKLAGLFGVAPAPGGSALNAGPVGVAWCLTSNTVSRYPVLFVRCSRAAMEACFRHTDFTVLVAYVDARYAAALRWLQRSGWHVAPAQPTEPHGVPFHPVTTWRHRWVS